MQSLKKLFSNEKGFSSLIETLVGSIIMVIAITGAGLVINDNMQVKLEAMNQNKAATLIDNVFTKAKGMPYGELSVYNTMIPARDTFSYKGCDNSLSTSFEGESEITSTSESYGLPFCVKEQQVNGKGIGFNIETHVTNVGLSGLNNDLLNMNAININGFHGKRITVIVSWYDGEKDSNDLPVMRYSQAEITLTPNLGDCVPYAASSSGACA